MKEELLLALLPTATVLTVLAEIKIFSRQRLFFASLASLASGAFLIYLDPHHNTTTVRALASSHALAATAGLVAFLTLGHGHGDGAASAAMVVTIVLMVLLDVVHPPAVSTSLTFAPRAGTERDIVLVALALGMIVALVALQRSAVWLLARVDRDGESTPAAP